MHAFPTRWLTHRFSPLALCAAATAAMAQTPAASTPRGDPLDAAARVPAVVYESVFRRDPPAANGQAIPWREANDTAVRIGGWRAYAREAQRAEPAPASPVAAPAGAAQPARPMPHGHGDHQKP